MAESGLRTYWRKLGDTLKSYLASTDTYCRLHPGAGALTNYSGVQEEHTRPLNLHSTALKTPCRCLRTTTGANVTEPVVVLRPLFVDSTCQSGCSGSLGESRIQSCRNMFEICVLALIIGAALLLPPDPSGFHVTLMGPFAANEQDWALRN